MFASRKAAKNDKLAKASLKIKNHATTQYLLAIMKPSEITEDYK